MNAYLWIMNVHLPMENRDGTVIFRADNIIIQGRLVDGRGVLVRPFTIDKKIE